MSVPASVLSKLAGTERIITPTCWCLCFDRFVLQALELQAGFPADSNNGQDAGVNQQQWEDFVSSFQDRLKLLRLIANVRKLTASGGCCCLVAHGNSMDVAKQLCAALPLMFV